MSVEASVQPAFCAALVDEWVRAGVADAVVCPGSRSTPLALALAGRPELRIHVRLDERGAGFFAIGLALAHGRPPVVCTTSGTAAAELHPAVVEADRARVPLLVCTADRPPELQAVGAPQTIRQTDLFGSAVRWFAEPGVPVTTSASSWRALGARAVAEASDGPSGPGPVHLNLMFRDPLVSACADPPPGRPGGLPWVRVQPLEGAVPAVLGDAPPGAALRSELERWSGLRGLVLAGARGGRASQVLALAQALGWPVLADPRSGCRLDVPGVVGAADAILRAEELRGQLIPEVVLVLGEPWVSGAVAELLRASATAGATVVGVDPWWRWHDPDRLVGAWWVADPSRWLDGAVAALGLRSRAPTGWVSLWHRLETAAQQAIDGTLDELESLGNGCLTEPGLARRLIGRLPTESWLVASSSMPVRDLEWFAPALSTPPRVVANRGVNGIDGVCSTAQGLAAGSSTPVAALVGDLAFLHDISSLVRSPKAAKGAVGGSWPEQGSCTLVVADNGGGGIFSFLAQAEALEESRFEALFGTPQVPDVSAVAAGLRVECLEVSTRAELDHALGVAVGAPGLRVVRVRLPDRRANVAIHRRLNEAVASAVREVEV
jgi:2-succinyl-5-enolpyruvyl-6-hydroxy-3-cyclohexene-1-carboxylate synthase